VLQQIGSGLLAKVGKLATAHDFGGGTYLGCMWTLFTSHSALWLCSGYSLRLHVSIIFTPHSAMSTASSTKHRWKLIAGYRESYKCIIYCKFLERRKKISAVNLYSLCWRMMVDRNPSCSLSFLLEPKDRFHLETHCGHLVSCWELKDSSYSFCHSFMFWDYAIHIL
jgi:hypothetical protein